MGGMGVGVGGFFLPRGCLCLCLCLPISWGVRGGGGGLGGGQGRVQLTAECKMRIRSAQAPSTKRYSGCLFHKDDRDHLGKRIMIHFGYPNPL